MDKKIEQLNEMLKGLSIPVAEQRTTEDKGENVVISINADNVTIYANQGSDLIKITCSKDKE